MEHTQLLINHFVMSTGMSYEKLVGEVGKYINEQLDAGCWGERVDVSELGLEVEVGWGKTDKVVEVDFERMVVRVKQGGEVNLQVLNMECRAKLLDFVVNKLVNNK